MSHLIRSCLIVICCMMSAKTAVSRLILNKTSIQLHQKLKNYTECPTGCTCSVLYKMVRCTGNGHGLSYIPKIPENTRNFEFTDNYLPLIKKETFQNISTLKLDILCLSGNKINFITEDAFSDFKDLEILYLSDNPTLTNDTVAKALYSFQNKTGPDLHLRKMRWTFLSNEMFQGVSYTNVTYIGLSHNLLESIDGSIFRNLTSLTSLDLSTNKISSFQMQGLLKLTVLDLSRNVFVQMPHFCNLNATSLVPELKELYLNENKIRVLDKHSFECLDYLSHLELNGNPLFFIGKNTLASMLYLNSIELKNIGSEEIFLRVKKQAFNSTSIVSLKLSFKANYVLIKDRMSIFEFLPNLKELFIEGTGLTKGIFRLLSPLLKLRKLTLFNMLLRHVPPYILSQFQFLTVLDLSGNFINSFEIGVFENATSLEILNLSGNDISIINETSFSSTFLSSLQSIDLSYNPFACTCENLWFRNWINTTKVHLDFYPNLYFCEFPAVMKSNGVMLDEYNPTVEECTEKSIVLLIVLPLISLVLAVIVTLLLIYKCRWRIRYRIFLIRKNRYAIFQDEDFMYDGYIIYSDDDRVFVHEKIIPSLEDKEGLSLCIRLRDFEPGRLILDNVVENMNRSRKIIAILSNNFVTDDWSQYELTLAQNRIVEEGQGTLIFIKLEDIENRHMSESLYVLFSTLKCLIWTNNEAGIKLFWEEMIMFLRTRNRVDFNTCNM